MRSSLRHRSSLVLHALLVVAIALVGLAWSPRAEAYPWMIRHDYTSCVQCHADPSGGSLLTPYGRAQGEVLLRTRYGAPEEDPGKLAEVFFGVVRLPEPLLLGGDFRLAHLYVKPKGADAISKLFMMQADLLGQVSVDRFRANGSIGYADEGAFPAALTHGSSDNLVARTYWAGVDLGADRQFLLRAGRINLPFGLRTVEHTLWARTSTRTDRNAAQQHGVALSYNGDSVRGELMGIAGNFQLSPDRYRERGYGGYLEWAPRTDLAIGASSLLTYANRDVATRLVYIRQAHGLFGRYSPVKPLVIMAEGDLLAHTQSGEDIKFGYVGLLQFDVEPLQGLHFMATEEILRQGPDVSPSYSTWGTINWFFIPRTDVRVDGAYQNIPAAGARTGAFTILTQLHVYL